MNHTPTPWTEEDIGGYQFEDDRTFILRAVNAHEAMLTALIRIAHEIEGRRMCINMAPSDPLAIAYRDVRTAIALAEGSVS